MFLNVSHHVLADLDHEYSVVTLSSKSSMRNSEIISKFVDREVPLTTASLPADGGDSLEVPAVHCFVDAAQTEKVMFVAFWVLEDVLAFYVEKSEGNGSGKKGDESILLELIREDRCVALAFWTDCQSFLGIGDSDVKA